ncbi:hypothetical protein B0I35DRAFT_444276 [Stachybotrys elegans]|uniref:Uncharacterized protein n=1 Tax=Stachybotrys elegans TaxID=80388 RepID=A0A8K0SJ63_9HYPO|nr:hypothetical protein B0I35DRAFT_444276 [Stachybotrys elegans]
MKFISAILMPLASVSAALVPRELPDGYDFSGELQVIGPLVDGGENVTLYGTVESVVAQIQSVVPEFKVEEEEEWNSTISSRDIEIRAHATHHFCRAGKVGAYGGSEAKRNQISREISYLRSIGDRTCGVNARSCVRVSCSNGAGIWWCNDNDYWYGEKCNDLANLAQIAVYKCERHMKADCWLTNPGCGNCGCKPIDEWVVWGQQFSSANHNVIVTADRC